ncbi:hypothetical protein L1987_70709 [Smallanthus sonchifolius]|uniref:Uncharacterized protein n=1 Tax=Smallanthus sonchifolius TaxID=185202 RepID=A0ACB9AQF6_9ASTR|nr:hypothetical protein L1987_70709 [Smallanthus sonchifolius]
MLLKFFGSQNHNNPPNPNPSFGEKPLILQIIHAGGMIERYYMAFPAAWIMDKYPNFVLVRPEIFRRPWDSIVRPEEILVPGQKYFVVPVPTVKKLHRRLRKPSIEMPNGVGEDEGKKKKRSNCRRLKKNNLRFSPSLSILNKKWRIVSFRKSKFPKRHPDVHPFHLLLRFYPSTRKGFSDSLRNMSDEKINAARLKIDLQELSLNDDNDTPSSTTARKSSTAKITCMCAPTNHPGSFKCRYHRNSASVGSNLSELGNRRTASVGANLYQLDLSLTQTGTKGGKQRFSVSQMHITFTPETIEL